MDSAAALKCIGYELQFLLAGNLTKTMYTGGGPRCEGMEECTVNVEFFFNSSLKVINQNLPKVTCSLSH